MAWVLLSVWHLKNQAIHKKNAEGDKMKKMTKVMWTSLVVGLFAAPGALLAAARLIAGSRGEDARVYLILMMEAGITVLKEGGI